MQVSFKYSQEDLIDATVRIMRRSKTLRRIRRRQLVWSAILLASIVVLIFRFSIFGVWVAAIAAIGIVAIDPYLYERRYRRHLGQLYKEKLGEENEFFCLVELAPEGLKTSDQSCQSISEWTSVEDVVPTSDSVDIFTRKGGCIVRNRAFSSPEERQQFIELARDNMIKARSADLN